MNETVSTANPLETERIGKLMVRYGIPSILAIVVNSLYNMVDQIFIGQGVGYLGNAATNVIMPLTNILLAFALMIGDGAASYMSLNLGRGKSDKAAEGTGNAITISVCIGVILTILFEVFLTPLCELFGATEASLPYALEYGRIIVLGFPVAVIAGGLGGVIRADGRPNVTLIGLLIGCITNCILDPLFIFVFDLGVKGAAWATIIGQALNAVFFIVQFFRFKSIQLKSSHFKPKASLIGTISSMGVASFITQIATVFVSAVMNNALVIYGEQSVYGGDIPLAAFGITQKVNLLVTGIVLGLATGIQPILGYNYGSGNHSRVKKTFKSSIICSVVVLGIAFVCFQMWPESIINLFGQESDLYMDFAVRCFRTFLLMTPIIGVGVIAGVFFQSLGKPLPSMILSLARQIIFLIPAILILSKCFGIDGLLWSGPVADGLSFVLTVIFLLAYWKKLFKEGAKNE